MGIIAEPEPKKGLKSVAHPGKSGKNQEKHMENVPLLHSNLDV